MEVILKEDIFHLGKMGDLVRVRDGYARNYLIPHGMVLVANRKNQRVLEHQKRVVAQQKDRVLRSAQDFKEKLDSLSLTIAARVGLEGKLFGSVTNMNIEKALKEKGIEVERRKIDISEPIKALGDYEVPVRLSAEVSATLKVSVVPQED